MDAHFFDSIARILKTAAENTSASAPEGIPSRMNTTPAEPITLGEAFIDTTLNLQGSLNEFRIYPTAPTGDVPV